MASPVGSLITLPRSPCQDHRVKITCQPRCSFAVPRNPKVGGGDYFRYLGLWARHAI